MPTPGSRWLAALLLLLLAGCTGLYQRTLPETPQTFARSSQGGELWVGAAETDITPEEPMYLAGYRLNRVSTAVHSLLGVRAFVLRQGGMKVAIVGIDNLGLQREDADWVKSGIAGYANGCVFLCSSHSHHAPDLVGMWGFYLLSSGRDRDYLALVRARVAEAVAAAERAARPATLWRGEGRVPARGVIKNSERKEVFDRRVTVLQARDARSGEPFAALLHVACHPEVLRSRHDVISSDFVGDWVAHWRAAGNGQAVFVNGALGAMVTPFGDPYGPEGVHPMVQRLAKACDEALAEAREVVVDRIEVRRADVFLPLTSPGLTLGRLTLAVPRPVYRDNVRSTVGWLRLGDLEIVTVPGEMEPGLAARIRLLARNPDLLVFGLVDDEVGYLMSERDARDREFAYERLMSPSRSSGERVVEALVGRREEAER
ncbi:MAG: hypothetical protein IT458_17525 [Planctomycetes bacterium]|nr:hypothetical protein [Planctomycetota bacterium]